MLRNASRVVVLPTLYPSTQMPYTLVSAFQVLSQCNHLYTASPDLWLQRKSVSVFWSPTVPSLCASCVLWLTQPWLFTSLHISVTVNKCLRWAPCSSWGPNFASYIRCSDDLRVHDIYSQLHLLHQNLIIEMLVSSQGAYLSLRDYTYTLWQLAVFFQFTILIGLLMVGLTEIASNTIYLVISHLLLPVWM